VQPHARTAFFSYSREDSDFALHLARDLKAAGASVWIDQLDIEPGQEWDSAIEAALIQFPRMLLILSPAAVESRHVKNEISLALDENKTIIPVLYRDCTLPLLLRRIQYVDLKVDYSRGLTILIRTLAGEQRAAGGAETATTAQREERAPPEHHRLAAGKRSVRQPNSALVSMSYGWITAVVALCLILIATSIWYWRLSRSRERKPETQNQQAHVETSSAPLSGERASKGSISQHQEPEVPSVSRPTPAKSAAAEQRAEPLGGPASSKKIANVADGTRSSSPPVQQETQPRQSTNAFQNQPQGNNTPQVSRARLWFDPLAVTRPKGSILSMKVLLVGARNAYSVPLNITYDHSVLELVAVADGGFLSQDGAEVTVISRDDTETATLQVTATRPPGLAGVSGYGTLVKLTFLAKRNGQSKLIFARAMARDPYMQPIPVDGSSEATITIE
jgi:hypothetical protein